MRSLLITGGCGFLGRRGACQCALKGVRDGIDLGELKGMAEHGFGSLVKAVVVKAGIIVNLDCQIRNWLENLYFATYARSQGERSHGARFPAVP